MRIRILGYAGSGKTTITKTLSEKYNLRPIFLDSFLKNKDKEEREELLNSKLSKMKDSWIVEGVQVSKWTRKSIAKADIIIILDYPLYLVQYRVVKRAVSQVFSRNRTFNQKKNSIKRMFTLFKWNYKFKKRLNNVKRGMYLNNARLIVLKTPKDSIRIFNKLNNIKRRNKNGK